MPKQNKKVKKPKTAKMPICSICKKITLTKKWYTTCSKCYIQVKYGVLEKGTCLIR